MVLGISTVVSFLCSIVKFTYNLFFGKVYINPTDFEEGWFGRGPRPKNDDKPTQAKQTDGNSDHRDSHLPSDTQTTSRCGRKIKQPLKVFPLLITHGWPGTFYEFYKMTPLLITPRPDQNFVFEVVCPSIPGYGFSESPCQKGFNAIAAARIFRNLMNRLGHTRFFVQGGDWGSFISTILAKYYTQRILGVHVNMLSGMPKSWDLVKATLVAYFPSLIPAAEYKAFYPFLEKVKLLIAESGYFHLQSTKPDTIGCALADSPVGLAAYILEKYSTWTDKENHSSSDGNLTKKFTLDELLTMIMIYWVNNNFTASARFYKENIGNTTPEKRPLSVPSGIALFPKELLMLPRWLISRSVTNLVSYTVMPRGGHFAAFEEPQLMAEDIWNFVSLVQKNRNY
ncbi:Epoxide hydrolase 1 like protein [Argiope bruennichi]|uniref:Epoxide hydrolase 1 like protein n=1 Tax=Argiope bruennichi TaxID=94029 RepID=A0A8T0E5F7_ARGBR|nr:Epoxide hydrolase 1 like protein [Argiope bruennichi]